VKSLIPSPDRSLEMLMNAADRMLYRAMEEGRNRIAVSAIGP
jgi:PleD family two-component response regulator